MPAFALLIGTLAAQNQDVENLQHKDPEVRRAAALILGIKKETRAIPNLIEGLSDKVLDVRAACHEALQKITGQGLNADDVKGWKEWWDREGRLKFPAVEADPKRIRETVEEAKISAARIKEDVTREIRQDLDKLRDDVKQAEGKVNNAIYLMTVVAILFILIMFYFVGHVSSRIKEWKDLMKEADRYIREGRQVTERVDAILDEVDKKKSELLDFFGKLKDDVEDEISRYADLLQQNSDHHVREEMTELRQKAEKELEATLGELKLQMDNEMRKLAGTHRAKIDAEVAEVHGKFLKDVEAHRLFMEGVFYTSNHRLDDAAHTYERLLELKPDHLLGRLHLGNVYRDMMKFDEAMGSYRKALELAPNDAKACYCTAALFAVTKNKERMLEFLRRAISNDGEFKDEALNDPAFREYWHDPEFKDVAEA